MIKSTVLPIHFAIVGAGLSGLTCAVALRRVGHYVTVLEALEDGQSTTRGLRLAPNATKILYHWGLDEEVKKVSYKSQAVILNNYESGELLGEHLWNEEVIKETRGEYRCIGYEDLRQVLLKAAVSTGAVIRSKSRVVHIDADTKPQCPSITLEDGEVIQADVIIGADGLNGYTSNLVIEEREAKDPMGLSVYTTSVPKHAMLEHADLALLLNDERGPITTWFGNAIAAIGFRYGGAANEGGYALQFYVPGESSDSWQDTPKAESHASMMDSLLNANPLLKKMASMSNAPHHTPASGSSRVDETEWIHDSGHIAVVGDAAHPMPVLVHPTCMAIEDGAVLARLFLHLKNIEQIPSFLYAFQDLRQPRVKSIREAEAGNLMFMMLEPGEMADWRDADLRAKRAAGRNALDPLPDPTKSKDAGSEGDDLGASLWQEIKEQFGYDAEDEADDWWVNWGLLREKSKGNHDFSHHMQVQIAMVEAC